MATKYQIKLTKLHCNHTTAPDTDEVYLIYVVDGGRNTRFPENGNNPMKKGRDWPLDIPITFEDNVIVSAYDQDFGHGHDDFLGSVTLYPSTIPPTVGQSQTYPLTGANNGADYTLTVETISNS